MLDWIILIAVLLGACALIGYGIYKLITMRPEQRREKIKIWLVQIISTIQDKKLYNTDNIKSIFKNKAPVTYKIIVALNKKIDLDALIQEALEVVQNDINPTN